MVVLEKASGGLCFPSPLRPDLPRLRKDPLGALMTSLLMHEQRKTALLFPTFSEGRGVMLLPPPPN